MDEVLRGSLLFLGDYFGTLAAARCLGRRGIDVALADGGWLSRTAVSKYVRTRLRAPDCLDSSAFVEWLRAERSLHGRVLFPTSDDLAYVFAWHRVDDSRPTWADALSHIGTFVRHPRSFLRSLAR